MSTIDFNKMQLPKVDQKQDLSRRMRTELSICISDVIVKLEKERGYKFLPYEIDLVFIERMKTRHESYLESAFEED